MVHKLRDDIILEKVSGIYLLVALRSAWGESPFALQIAPITALIWQSMKNGLNDTEIINEIMEKRSYSKEKAEKILSHFIRSAEGFNYFSSKA